jgi:RNA polymerase-binding transcription factor DksA
MDDIDVAQRRQQEAIDHALAARPIPKAGRSHCEMMVCRQPISPERQRLGAVLCIECQRDAEHTARSCARAAI